MMACARWCYRQHVYLTISLLKHNCFRFLVVCSESYRQPTPAGRAKHSEMYAPRSFVHKTIRKTLSTHQVYLSNALQLYIHMQCRNIPIFKFTIVYKHFHRSQKKKNNFIHEEIHRNESWIEIYVPQETHAMSEPNVN